ncbi:GntR family transcriptional regulator [Paenibacillus montaniterrae]|uniref:GntR family transcriptional regulator n=2 Tax=Paenibacillus montaniterrae TaxID=429341 RepID=A0A919YNR6_9BACL|nr:GntR family transcriptional regulator [Paenibacillus montaniterrae]
MLNFYELHLNNKDPVYMQLASYVKRQILLGHAAAGDRLPSRREIATQLNINPNTVQKAFKLMEDEGYVRTSSTQGSIIYIDDTICAKIEDELMKGLIREFIGSAKEVNLSFKKVVELISELWEE